MQYICACNIVRSRQHYDVMCKAASANLVFDVCHPSGLGAMARCKPVFVRHSLVWVVVPTALSFMLFHESSKSLVFDWLFRISVKFSLLMGANNTKKCDRKSINFWRTRSLHRNYCLSKLANVDHIQDLDIYFVKQIAKSLKVKR